MGAGLASKGECEGSSENPQERCSKRYNKEPKEMPALIAWSEKVSCPKCRVEMRLRTLRFSHICGRRPGRPRKFDPDGSPWSSAVAALESRLAARALKSDMRPDKDAANAEENVASD